MSNNFILSTSANRSPFREAFFNETSKRGDSLQGVAFFIQGADIKPRQATSDVDLSFRQESHFYYLTGCSEPGCALLLNPTKREAVLIVPEYDDEYALWCGEYPVADDYKQKLGFDRVEYKSSTVAAKILSEWKTERVYPLDTQESINSDLIKKEVTGIEVVSDTNRLFYVILKDLRLIKTQDEIEQLRKMCQISGEAHKTLMQKARPGMNERELEAIFRYETMIKAGSTHMAYDPIVAGEDRGATLHYIRNDQDISDGSLVLVDAGAETPGSLYNSDITRVFPINGKFTEKQRQIYQIVLDSQMAVLEAMKPGALWEDMHKLAERVITKGLLSLGILKVEGKEGEAALEELIQNHAGAVFFPHGIGHSLGLDVHDPPNRDGTFERLTAPGIKNLRLRVTLQKGMVLTVEPGCYFNKRMIDSALRDETLKNYLNKDLIDQYMSVGGVRIEDDVAVTDDGIDNLCLGVPKTIEEVETVMKK